MKRQFGIDLIRTIAIIFVLVVHCFLNIEFYNQSYIGISTYCLLLIRNIAFVCVPLFLILTGYCMADKKLEKGYFSKIIKIIIVYLLISIISLLYKIFYLNEPFTIHQIIDIFTFKLNGYSWYVEMYIGLFLIIPFLNIIYENLYSKNHKRVLFIVLAIITTLPLTFSDIHIEYLNLNIFPSYWRTLYPILYYYIGCYIKEYKPSNNKIVYILIFISTLLIESTIVFYMGYGNPIILNSISKYGSIFAIVLAVLVFLLFYKTKIHGNIMRKAFEIIANNTLGIYLFSFIYDNLFYGLIHFKGSYGIQAIKSLVLIVPLVFICSLISSILLNELIKLFKKLIKLIKEKHKKNNLKKTYY